MRQGYGGPGGGSGLRPGRLGDRLDTADRWDPADRLDPAAGSASRLGVRIRSVRDPADDVFGAEGIGVPSGQRSLIVASALTNLGRTPYLAPPDIGLVLVDEHGDRHGRAVATLTALPRFRHGPVEPGETVSGHTYFLLPRSAALVRIEWTSRPGEDEQALTWLP